MRMSQEKTLDLVEIAPMAKPPVCKIIDFGKFKYEQQKRDKIQRKNQTVFKLKHAQNFVQEGNKVKVCVMFKGREMAYTDQGETLLKRFIERTEDIAKVESPIKMEGRNMNIILVPASKKQKKS
jgi:translation initiation factor IF-3